MSRKRGFKLHFMSFCLAVFVIFSTFFYAPMNAYAQALGTVNVGTGRVSSGWQYGAEHWFEFSNANVVYDGDVVHELWSSENTFLTSTINIPMNMTNFKFPSDVSSVIMSLTSNIQYGFTMSMDTWEYLHCRSSLYIREVALILNGERYILPISSNEANVVESDSIELDDGSSEIDSEVCFLNLDSYVSFDLNNLKDISRWDMSLEVVYDLGVFARYLDELSDLKIQPWVNWYAGTGTETFKFYCYSDGSEELQKDLIALQQQENTLQETGNNLQSQGNQIAQQTQDDINSGFDNVANGYDSSAGDSMNEGFSSSLNDYQTSQDSLFASVSSGINDFSFTDFSSIPGLVTSLSFVTSLMTSIYLAMGSGSGPLGIVLAVLFSIMFVSLILGLYRYYSSKRK